MADTNYEIIEKDGGFAFKMNDEVSRTFETREQAEEAARHDAEVDSELREGLEETFPASDPVSVTRDPNAGKD